MLFFLNIKSFHCIVFFDSTYEIRVLIKHNSFRTSNDGVWGITVVFCIVVVTMGYVCCGANNHIIGRIGELGEWYDQSNLRNQTWHN